jgi:hypothetical protein
MIDAAAKWKSIAVTLVFFGAMLAGAGFAVQTAEKRAQEPIQAT